MALLARRLRRATTRGPASLIDRTTGTNIGNATEAGGLAAAFDGVTNQSIVAGARRSNNTLMWIGKTVATPTAVEKVTIFGSNDQGYHFQNPVMTVYLHGKNGAAPTAGTEGTVLGSISFTDTANESAARDITSSDINSYWDHVWVRVTSGTTSNTFLAELQITGWQ